MKRKADFIIAILAIIVLQSCPIAGAVANTGFSLKERSIGEKQSFLENINITLLQDEPPHEKITCFDVSENGSVAVSSVNGNQKTICIYSKTGVFQYGYSLYSYGKIGIGWNNETELILYFVRAKLAVIVNVSGEVREIYEILNTIENNDYWNHTVFAKKREVNGVEYRLQNHTWILNFLSSSYSQITIKTIDGRLYTFYSAGKNYLISSFITILLFILLLLIGCIVAITIQCNQGIIRGRSCD